MNESDFLALLRPLATHASARGLMDDAAVLSLSKDGDLVLTHDVLVEGVHFLPDDPPEDVAWKLVAVNLSDLAAKGAVPVGVLLGYPLSHDAWDRAFVRGLGAALAVFDVALLGGDTVKGAARPVADRDRAECDCAVAVRRAGGGCAVCDGRDRAGGAGVTLSSSSRRKLEPRMAREQCIHTGFQLSPG